ncbi:MAG TPA: thiamine biosynthesis protein ThiS, partial [Candidatus Hydrogenedentes bacterium]|nr:thiamine biosynthesis protein ThiS [Candidatus Hydrogenedentota bacterium]
MRIVVNGKPLDTAEGATVSALLEQRGLNPKATV